MGFFGGFAWGSLLLMKLPRTSVRPRSHCCFPFFGIDWRHSVLDYGIIFLIWKIRWPILWIPSRCGQTTQVLARKISMHLIGFSPANLCLASGGYVPFLPHGY